MTKANAITGRCARQPRNSFDGVSISACVGGVVVIVASSSGRYGEYPVRGRNVGILAAVRLDRL